MLVIFQCRLLIVALMACLEILKRKGSRVEGGRVIQLLCLKVFYGKSGRSLEGFGRVWRGFNHL